MKIGIIVYSQTGNTLVVAQKLENVLKAAGHIVSMERVEAVSEGERALRKPAPDIISYDGLIFASPVQAFSLAPIMKLYLAQISNLADKQVSCFVTQHFKKKFLGGNRAVSQITAACKAKGAKIEESGIIHWSSEMREQQIDELVLRLSSKFLVREI